MISCHLHNLPIKLYIIFPGFNNSTFSLQVFIHALTEQMDTRCAMNRKPWFKIALMGMRKTGNQSPQHITAEQMKTHLNKHTTQWVSEKEICGCFCALRKELNFIDKSRYYPCKCSEKDEAGAVVSRDKLQLEGGKKKRKRFSTCNMWRRKNITLKLIIIL